MYARLETLHLDGDPAKRRRDVVDARRSSGRRGSRDVSADVIAAAARRQPPCRRRRDAVSRGH